ncbi:MAG TPA: DinB family protein [Anaerolineales bacterium]|nr:DinB family protein [Anaerolineales bacterium]HRQ92810.1 DinB family protein [Anaerolineales bacterium]
MLKDLLLDLYDFTCWGRELMLEHAAKLTPEQYEEETRFPIKSVKETLVHTLSAERAYRTRCAGLPTAAVKSEEFADLAALRAYWQDEETQMRAYLTGASEDELAGSVTYKVSTGEEFTRARLELLKQLFFHSMQHRAELAQMLTEFGHSPGNIDYTMYLLKKQG